MVCTKLHFCNSPRRPLVFKGTQQSLKPHCCGNFMLSRCILCSIHCSAFIQNLGGKSSAPLFCVLPSPPTLEHQQVLFTLFPVSSISIPALSHERGRRAMGAAWLLWEHQGLEGALFPGNAFPAGTACTAQLGGGRSPGFHPPFLLTGPGSRSRSAEETLGAARGRHRRFLAPPPSAFPRHGVPQYGVLQLGAEGRHKNDTQVCTHQARRPNKESGRVALQSHCLLPLWSWICPWHAPAGAAPTRQAVPRPCALTGVNARSVRLLHKNEVFLLPGC